MSDYQTILYLALQHFLTMASYPSVSLEIEQSRFVAAENLVARSPLALDPLKKSSSVLFIDSGVTDAEQLIAGAAAGTTVYRLVEGDGISQITEVLSGLRDVASVQIVSHGRSGGLQLGGNWLDLQTLPGYVNQLKSWGQALTADADVLLYGCHVAQGEIGKTFVDLLAQTTGADVAASDDLTGNTALGGDWDLEVRTGEIALIGAFVADSIAAYQGTFVSFSGTSSNVNVGLNPRFVMLEDVNSDGKLDLLSANLSSNDVSVRLGDGAGGFTGTTNISVGVGPRSIALGDVNGDGKLDLFTANYDSDNVSVRLGDGAGGFIGSTNITVGQGPRFATLGDVNSDGKLDLLTANYRSDDVSVRLGDGMGGFTSAPNVGVSGGPWSVTLGDINSDGKLDLITPNAVANNVSVRLGNGNGTFSGTTNFSIGSRPNSATLRDVNGDGKLDLLVANYGSNDVAVRFGDGAGSFTGSTKITVGVNAQSASVGDVNGDGKLDLLSAAQGSNHVAVRLGDGAGSFTGSTNVSVGSEPLSTALGDLNGDGKLDLIAANYASNDLSVRLNTTPKVTVAAGIAPVEGSTSGSFIVTLDQPAPVGGLVVNYSFAGTATVDSDYSFNQAASSNITAITAGSFVIAAGATTATLSVTAPGDGTADPNETIALNILSGDYFRDNTAVRFVDPTTPEVSVGKTPYDVTLGDVNRDGHLDMITANGNSNNVLVQLGNGTGDFTGDTTVSVGNGPQDVILGDVNGDGRLDFLTANYFSNTVSVRLGDGVGGFIGNTDVTIIGNPYSIALGDLNGDGKLDFLTANSTSQTVSVRLGDGMGGFTGNTDISVGAYPRSIVLADVNGDGKLDLLCGNEGSNTVSVRLGNGSGGFTGNTNVSVGSAPMSVVLGDVNSDGKLDLVTGNVNSNDVSIRLGDGSGGFTGNTNVNIGSQPISVTLGDVNRDGNLDLITANISSKTVSVRLGDGLGGFTGNTSISVGTGPHAVMLGDVNSDGTSDLLVANFLSDTVSVRLNQIGASLVIQEPPATAPTIGLGNTAVTYAENNPAIIIDSSATIADPDSPNFNTGTLTISLTTGGTTDDRLAIQNEGTLSGKIGVSGSMITYGGGAIASFVGGNGTEPLVITFNAAATPAIAQRLLQNITYANVSDQPSTAPRTVNFVLSDGSGDTSTTATKTINVTTVDDAAVGVPGGQLTWNSTNTLPNNSPNITGQSGIEIKDGFLYTTDYAGGNIDIYSISPTTGGLTYESSFGALGSGVDNFAYPVGLSFYTTSNGQTKAYVPDQTNRRIVTLDLNPTTGALSWNTASGFPNLSAQSGIEIKDDFLYVTDTAGNNIDIYSINPTDGGLTYQSSFGSSGNGVGGFSNAPIGLSFYTTSNGQTKAYVPDAGNKRIVVLDLNAPGNLSWDTANTLPNNSLNIDGQYGIEIKGHLLYATDYRVSNIDIYRINPTTGGLTYQASFGSLGTGVNNFAYPIGLSFYTTSNGQSYAYVPDYDNRRIVVLDVAPEMPLSVTGKAQEGGSLIATLAGVTDPDGAIVSTTYQWQSSGDNGTTWSSIAGATSATYNIPNEQSVVGTTVRVMITTTDIMGGTTAFTSTPQAITNVNDLPTGSVTVSGKPTEKQRLTAANTVADDDGLGSITYQWQSSSDNGTSWNAISGANNPTFILGLQEVNQQIRVAATYTDKQGTIETVYSATTNSITRYMPQPDLLLRNSGSGEVGIWGLDNTQILAGDYAQLADGTIVAPDASWKIVSGQFDFNNDGVRDIVWFNSVTTETAIWYMQLGAQGLANMISKASFTYIPFGEQAIAPGGQWQLTAVADLLDGGTPEFLWEDRNSGASAIWQLDITSNGLVNINLTNSSFITSNDITKTPLQTGGRAAGWRIIGVGNFDDELTTRDLLWFNEKTTETAIWQLNGTVLAGGNFITSGGNRIKSGLGWKPVLIGNVDGTGTDEIIWQNGTRMATWAVGQGSALTTKSAMLNESLAVGEQIQGLVDMDLNGTLDLVVRRKSDGPDTTQVYYLNGSDFQLSTPTSSRYITASGQTTPITTGDSRWDIAAIAELGDPLVNL
jgi:Domain of unknown function (DUF4347)/FG-GAP-like repeat